MSFVVDDTCLEGQTWDPVIAISPEAYILNAVGLFYSGQKERAEEILMRIGGDKLVDVTGLYILARCYEDKKDWNAAEKIYNTLIVLHNKDIDMGMQSPIFRKVIYRVAVLNETVFHQRGAHLLQGLMGECLTYTPYNVALRNIYLGGIEEDLFGDDSEGCKAEPTLADLFVDKSVTNEDFIAELKKRKAENSPDIGEYRTFIRELDFEEPRN